jgi:hypothetical protein
MHPDFRMIVLANRPGFPFLGNDFYAVLGDVFSCHVIDNPDLDSEMSLLAQYGPNVPEHVLLPLAKAFQDLRKLADEGTLPYPYSTREAVAVVKHLSVSNACSSTIQCLEFIIRDPPSNLYLDTPIYRPPYISFLDELKNSCDFVIPLRSIPPITYYWTGLLILDHSYLVGNLTNSKIAETKAVEPLKS